MILTLYWRCSFRQSGQCEGLYGVERVTGLAPRFCVYISGWISSTRESVDNIVNGIIMEILSNNPYRLLGVYANSPTKERLANHNRMKAFLKVGKSVSFSLDLPQYLSPVNRTESIIADADSKLTLPKDQIHYAQFWFVKTTTFDEIAFNHLFAGEIDKAEEIWQKKECASSLQNLIVCALMQDNYGLAMSCAETLYGNTQYVDQLVTSIVRTGGNSDDGNLAFSFLDVLCEEVSAKKLLPYIAKDTWKGHIVEKAVKPIIDSIQEAIKTAEKSKGKGSYARLNAGRNLLNGTKAALLQLMNLLPVSDVQYQTIVDKLAGEILQCGIDYFNDTNDDDAPQNAMYLQKYALSIAVGPFAKDRCRECVDELNNVSSEYLVRNELLSLRSNIQQLQDGRNLLSVGWTINDIKLVVEESLPKLESVKNKLGPSSDLCIKVGSIFVSETINAIVNVVNYRLSLPKNEMNLNKLRISISSAISLMDMISEICIDLRTRKYLNGTMSTFKSTMETFSQIDATLNRNSQHSNCNYRHSNSSPSIYDTDVNTNPTEDTDKRSCLSASLSVLVILTIVAFVGYWIGGTIGAWIGVFIAAIFFGQNFIES